MALRAVRLRMHVSMDLMATLVCAHGTTITVLTNREPSEPVAECILCALQVRTLTIIISLVPRPLPHFLRVILKTWDREWPGDEAI